jgi:6-pyruvoyltetrahydropterin/6-carboxytetrahydropterin synthase
MKPQYRVVLEKPSLVFSAAHFITFNGNICERLHGHNYHVRASVWAELDENRYVIDFIAFRDALLKMCMELDHHVILPESHPQIHVVSDEKEVTATFEDRRWVFPKEDCVLLPVQNTTAEEIAHTFAQRLLKELTAAGHTGITRLSVGVDENDGQWGEVELTI